MEKTKQEIEVLEELHRLEVFLMLHPDSETNIEMQDRIYGLDWVIQTLNL